MAHIQFLTLASPQTHKDIQKEINTWMYEIEGQYFKGKKAPFLSEIKCYDVRIREEHIAQFLADFELETFEDNVKITGDAATQGLGAVKRIFKWFRRLSPYKPLGKRSDKKMYKMKSWHYSYALGKLNDPVQTSSVTGDEREVL